MSIIGLKERSVHIFFEMLLCAIALLLTTADVIFHSILFLCEKAARLLFQLTCTLLLASIFILAYLLFMAIHTAITTGLNAQTP